jgi:methionyl-tRNA formyltransferase
MKPRAVFMGTPAFAVPCLDALCDVAEVALVVSQPDKPQGRGLELAASPVKQFASQRGIPVFQPERARDGRLQQTLAEAKPDLALVVAYGKILPADVLNTPRLGCLNVHGSLLPRYRGAAPIQWAVVHGERETGVCLMQMDVGMDTGPVLDRRVLPIGENETGGELFERLSLLSGELVRSSLPRFVAGELTPVAQASDGVSHAPMIKKEDGALDFAQDAQAVHDRARGLYPWPGAFTALAGRRIKVHVTRVVEAGSRLGEPGVVLSAAADGIVVACGSGAVRLVELQLEGKRRMDAAAFLAGHPLKPGARFAAHGELIGAA